MRQLKIKLENLQFMQAGADDGSDPTKALLAENMPLLLNTAWSLSALDIESSVSESRVWCVTRAGSIHVFVRRASFECTRTGTSHHACNMYRITDMTDLSSSLSFLGKSCRQVRDP